MKQMKIWIVALTFIMGLSFTSCVNSDNDTWNVSAYVTTNSMYPYDATLLGDDGVNYIPTNPSALRWDNSDEYAKRALVYMKYVEGEDGAPNKASYSVEIVGASGITVKSLNQLPDTLENSYPVNDFGIWAINGYITVASALYITSNSIDLELFLDYETIEEEGVKDNIVPMKYQFTQGGTEYGGTSNATPVVSWTVPSADKLYEYGVNMSDSVVFKISAKNSSSSELTRTYKYKY